MVKMDYLGAYKNGNTIVAIKKDGTKIVGYPDDAEPDYDWATNIDCKITDFCEIGCPVCHEGSTPSGKHGDIMNQKWVETLHPYQELAIGGGRVTSHPDLIPFLKKLKDLKVIANITVNNKEFAKESELISSLIKDKYVHGVGVSLNKDASIDDNDFDMKSLGSNVVFHSIVGYTDIDKLIEKATEFESKNIPFKVLLLGYKYLRRGEIYASKNEVLIDEWKSKLKQLTQVATYVSFDCLALDQLDVKNTLEISDDEWDRFYQGDDGTSTFYIDAVKEQFAKMSTVPVDGDRFPLLDNVNDMFHKIKNTGTDVNLFRWKSIYRLMDSAKKSMEYTKTKKGDISQSDVNDIVEYINSSLHNIMN